MISGSTFASTLTMSSFQWTLCLLFFIAQTVAVTTTTSEMATASLSKATKTSCTRPMGTSSGASVNIRLLKSSETNGWDHTSYQLKKTTGDVPHEIRESFHGTGKIDDHSVCLDTDHIYSFEIDKILMSAELAEEEAMIGAFVCGKFISPGESLMFRVLTTGKCLVSTTDDRASLRTTLGDRNDGGLVLQAMDGGGLYSYPYSYSGAYMVPPPTFLPSFKPVDPQPPTPTIQPTTSISPTTAILTTPAAAAGSNTSRSNSNLLGLIALVALLPIGYFFYYLTTKNKEGASKEGFVKIPTENHALPTVDSPGGGGGGGGGGGLSLGLGKVKKYIKVPMELSADSPVKAPPTKF